MSPIDMILLAFIGLGTGAIGGLLGIGGSIIIIPALNLIFLRDFHLAQASAMIVNIFVAVPATISHHRAKAILWKSVFIMLPFGIVFILLGVEAGNKIDALILERIFSVFLIYVVVVNVHRLIAHRKLEEPTVHKAEWWQIGIVGSIVGFFSGVLGIGGGIITVPLCQRVCGFPLRQSIALSSAVMCLTAVIGAGRKNSTLVETVGDAIASPLQESIFLAACIAPAAFLGGFIGAKLTHILPVNYVRWAFVILLTATAIRMFL